MNAYFASDDITQWNENNVINAVENDRSLTINQKNLLAKCIAFGKYITSEILLPYTRATKEDCRKAFDTAVARICRNFVIAGAAGLATGGIGTGVAAVIAYIAIDEAESDYNNCMKTAK